LTQRFCRIEPDVFISPFKPIDMKYLQLTLRFPSGVMHPMHRFIDESDAIDRDVLVHGQTVGKQDTFLFYVEGQREPYENALRAADQITDFEITDVDAEGFYCFLTQTRNTMDEAIFETFYRTGVIVTPPIEFLPDGIAKVTVIGKPDALQSTIDDIPTAIEATIDRIGEYNWDQALFDPGLTDRQQQVVEAAVNSGYYSVPRENGIEAVAENLDCSTSTAGEHLRKAESRLAQEYMGLTDEFGESHPSH
jgi:predicted DNA binding protein